MNFFGSCSNLEWYLGLFERPILSKRNEWSGTTTNVEEPGFKAIVESYKSSLKTCADYYSSNMLSSFPQDCILSVTSNLKDHGKKECFFEAQSVCIALCLEKCKAKRLISYQDFNSYCS